MNCGHDSHCGVPFFREEKNDKGEPYNIEVCKTVGVIIAPQKQIGVDYEF